MTDNESNHYQDEFDELISAALQQENIPDTFFEFGKLNWLIGNTSDSWLAFARMVRLTESGESLSSRISDLDDLAFGYTADDGDLECIKRFLRLAMWFRFGDKKQLDILSDEFGSPDSLKYPRALIIVSDDVKLDRVHESLPPYLLDAIADYEGMFILFADQPFDTDPDSIQAWKDPDISEDAPCILKSLFKLAISGLRADDITVVGLQDYLSVRMEYDIILSLGIKLGLTVSELPTDKGDQSVPPGALWLPHDSKIVEVFINNSENR